MRPAADANVLLSAVLGGRARLIFASPMVEEIFTTQHVMDEVSEYAPLLAAKRGLNPESILLAVAVLPVVVVPDTTYRRKIAEAGRRLNDRDPDDVDLLALALHFRIPVWSNDRDFSSARVRWFTTAALMAELGVDK